MDGGIFVFLFDPAALRRILHDRGLSVAEVARTLRVPSTTVSGWLNARHRPAAGSVERLARALSVPVEDLFRPVRDTTPGVQGGVPLSLAQALVLAVAVALVADNADTLTADWLNRLRPGERETLQERLVLSPQWAWAWDKLAKLGAITHPLQGYEVSVRIIPPKTQEAKRR